MRGAGIKAKKRCSDELRAILKEKKVSRGEAIQGFWGYVKRHKLQSSSDGRIVKVGEDDKLKALFPSKLIKKDRKIESRGKSIKIKAGRVFMTEVAAALSEHLS